MKRRSQAGFTLVEMIVATFLLAIGVVSAMVAFSSATRASAFASEVNTAALLAQRQMTQLELQPDNLTGGEQQGDFGEEYPGYRWLQNVETTAYQNLFKVTVVIQWGSSSTPHERVFTTYRSNGQQQNNKQQGSQQQTNQQQPNNGGNGTGPGANSNGG